MKSCEFNISKKKEKTIQNPFILNPENLQTGSNQNSKYLIWQDSGGELCLEELCENEIKIISQVSLHV